jgi:ankyrin repeat protein
MAILCEKQDAAKLLIANGSDANAKDDDGSTPLHYAVVMDDAIIVELLLAAKADVNAKGEAGRTPLSLAVGWRRAKGGTTKMYEEVVDLLRRHGGLESV